MFRPLRYHILQIDFSTSPPTPTSIPSSPRLARAKRHLKRLIMTSGGSKFRFRLDGRMHNPAHIPIVAVPKRKAPHTIARKVP